MVCSNCLSKEKDIRHLLYLTTLQGTQIHATMFNEVAKNFIDRFKVGKVYYISKVNLNVDNKQFKTVQNDYTTTLNDKSQVIDLAGKMPHVNFVNARYFLY